MYRDLLKVILPTLNMLPQPTSLLWFVTAARPLQEGANPFPLESILGQTGHMLKRTSNYKAVGSETPVWPIISLTTPQGTLAPDFFRAYCVPRAKAVVGKEADEEEVEQVAVMVNRKKRIKAKSKRTETLIHRRLQQFHTSLALVWSLAQSVTSVREFEFIVTSLEILLAAQLLTGFKVP